MRQNTSFLSKAAATLFAAMLTCTTARAQLSNLTYNTAGGFYEIRTVADLQALANYYDGTVTSGGIKFKMMQDINLNGVNTSFLPIASANSTYYFADEFDGNGYAIKNLSLVRGSDSNATYFGLFHQLASTATVQNLTLLDCDVRYTGSTNYMDVGAIAGRNFGTIKNCTVIGTVANHDNQYNVGAIVGSNFSPGKVENCTAIAGQPVVGNLYGSSTPGTVTGSNAYYRLLTSSAVSLTTTPAATTDAGTACYAAGTALSLTVTPNDGTQMLTDVTFNGTTATKTAYGQYSLTMPAGDVNVSASLATKITVAQASNGSVTPSTYSPAVGGQVTLTIAPNTGYALSNITATAGGSALTLNGSGNTRTFTMPDKPVSITASFSAISYTISGLGSKTGGSISASSNTAHYGGQVTLTATPATGYSLQTLTVTTAGNQNVALSGSGNTRTFTMPAENVTVTASFSLANYTISIGSMTGGSISASSNTAHYGDQVTLTAVPDEGYYFQSLAVATEGSQNVALSGSDNTRTFTMPAGNVTVSAVFHALFDVNITAFNCTVEASPLHAAPGETITFTITPDSGATLQQIIYNPYLAVTGSGNTRYFTMPAENVTVTVVCSIEGKLVGSGTPADPYRIYNETDLRMLSSLSKTTDFYEKYFRLEDDITMSNEPMLPIGYIGNNSCTFWGYFDGNCHTISNLYVNQGIKNGLNYINSGLFGNNLGTIINLTLSNCTITGDGEDAFIGGIAGSLAQQGTIINCHVTSGTVSSTNNKTHVGGIVGENYGNISTCSNGAGISGPYKAGGIAGQMFLGSVIGCLNSGSVTNGKDEGGIMGDYISGIVGDYKEGTLKNNYYFGNCKIEKGTNLGDVAANQGAVRGYAINKSAGVTLSSIEGHAEVAHPAYAAAGETVSFTVAPPENYFVATVKYNDGSDHTLTADSNGKYSFTMPEKPVSISATFYNLALFGSDIDPLVDGSTEHPYIISTTAGWNFFCDALEDNARWNRFTDKTLKLGDDIAVTRMAGSEGHEFCGTFDGDGHTITVSYGSSGAPLTEDNVAPFRYANGNNNEIKNLRIAGTIYTSGQYAAGFVAQCKNAYGYSTINFINCRSSVTINSSTSGDGNHGGFVGVGNTYYLTFSGCLFDGRLIGTSTQKWGGFVGHRESVSVRFHQCVFDPDTVNISNTESATFCRNNTESSYQRCYYKQDINDGKNFTGQGHRLRSITPDTGVTVGLSGNATHYNVSGITIYGGENLVHPGLQYGDTYYAGSGEEVSITLSPSSSAYVVSGYSVSGGTLGHSGTNGWTLTMPDADVTISANYTINPNHFEQSDNTYTIKTAAGWDVFCDLLAKNDKGYFSGKTVKLGNDIGTAQEPITTMAGYDYHDFTGTFDGNGKTLTICYGSASSPINENNVAPFRNLQSYCIIKDLHVAGDIYTSGKFAGGLAGTMFGTVKIENCLVSTVIHSYTSGDGTHGGIVGLAGNQNSTNLTIEGCVFDGKLLTCGATETTSCSGFLGYKHYTVSISNSLYAPAALEGGETEVGTDASATFARNDNTDNLNISNCYFSRTLGTAQGIAATRTPDKPSILGAETTAYSVSGITVYTCGMYFDGGYYVASSSEYYRTLTAAAATVLDESKYVTTFFDGTLAYQLPEGTKAYTASLDGSKVVFHLIGDDGSVIPKNTAVIIVADANSITLAKLESTEVTAHAGNILQGSDSDISKPAGTVYVLGITDNAPGFYKFTGSTIPAGKAYYVAQ